MSADILQIDKLSNIEDVDQEGDKRLRNELKQMIAEQFDEYDLSDDDENCNPVNAFDSNFDALNKEDMKSIMDAGDLVALESAIQRFAEESSKPDDSSDSLYGAQPLTMEKHHDKPFQENLPLLSSPFRNIRDFIPKGLVFSDQQDPILNNREISNFLSYSTDFSTCGDNMAQNPIQNRILQDYSDRKEASNISQVNVDWDLSMLDEVGGVHFESISGQHVSTTSGSQFDLTSHNSRPFSSVPSASAPFAPAPELLVSTSLPFYPPNPNALISNISTVSDASLVPPRLVIDNKTTNDYGHEQLLHLASDSHFGEMVRSQSPKEPPIIWDAESLIKGSGGRLDRLELLYTLRGQHLAAAKLQIEEMRNASEKAERISKHKIILMEAEKLSIEEKLTSVEKEAAYAKTEINHLCGELELRHKAYEELEEKNNQLSEQLASVQASQASLSAQLVELTSSEASKRTQSREARLADALGRRQAVFAEQATEALEAANQRIVDKEKEIAVLRQDLELQRHEILTIRRQHSKAMETVSRQLEEARQHSTQLSSTVLYSEVSELRSKVRELATSKLIADDVNNILQEEVQDLREQLIVYEGALNLSQREENALSPRSENFSGHPVNHSSVVLRSTHLSSPGPCADAFAPAKFHTGTKAEDSTGWLLCHRSKSLGQLNRLGFGATVNATPLVKPTAVLTSINNAEWHLPPTPADLLLTTPMAASTALHTASRNYVLSHQLSRCVPGPPRPASTLPLLSTNSGGPVGRTDRGMNKFRLTDEIGIDGQSDYMEPREPMLLRRSADAALSADLIETPLFDGLRELRESLVLPTTAITSRRSDLHSNNRDTAGSSRGQQLLTANILTGLRRELERCLEGYRLKREQVTNLRETLFSVRCQLHQAKGRADKSDSEIKLLRDRVAHLEWDLSNTQLAISSPGPRELALSGHLDRLKRDFSNLEEELQQCLSISKFLHHILAARTSLGQSTRSRLQTALANEARAIETEKAAKERIEGMVADREAAVERARSLAEAHYTSLRRRLEAEWNAERDEISKQAEQQLGSTRKELANFKSELERVLEMYYRASNSAKQSLEAALNDAMHEREAECLRIWREEFPKELVEARKQWILETKIHETEAIRASVEEAKLAFKTSAEEELALARRKFSEEFEKCRLDTENRVRRELLLSRPLMIEKAISTDQAAKDAKYSKIISTSDASVQSIFDKGLALTDNLGILLHQFAHLLQCSRDESENLALVNELTSHIMGAIQEEISNQQSAFCGYIDAILGQIVYFLQCFLEPVPPPECLASFIRAPSQPHFPTFSSPRTGDLLDYSFEATLVRLSKLAAWIRQSVPHSSPAENGLHSRTNCIQEAGTSLESMQSAGPISNLSLSAGNNEQIGDILSDRNSPETCKEAISPFAMSAPIAGKLGPNAVPDVQLSSLEVMEQLKVKISNYIATCQSRAAHLLHKNLSRVHRRACRHFAARLRKALSTELPGLHEATLDETAFKLPSLQATQRMDKPIDSHLNSILLVIDAVCTSTEAAFADDSCKSLSPISPEILINHPFASQSVSNPSDSTASKGLTRVSAVRHPHPHSSSSTSVSLASQAVASLQRISETPLRSASSRIDDGNICYGTSSLSHATSGVGVARPLAGVDIPANRNLCKLQSFPEPCQQRNQPLEHLFRSASAMSYLVAASPKPKFNLMDNSFPIMPTRRACSSCQGSLTNSKDLEDGVDGGGVSLFTDPSAKRHPEEAEISTRTPQSPSLRQLPTNPSKVAPLTRPRRRILASYESSPLSPRLGSPDPPVAPHSGLYPSDPAPTVPTSFNFRPQKPQPPTAMNASRTTINNATPYLPKSDVYNEALQPKSFNIDLARILSQVRSTSKMASLPVATMKNASPN